MAGKKNTSSTDAGAGVGRGLLAASYWLAVVPAGRLLRGLGRRLIPGIDPSAGSYRVPSVPRPPRDMEKPC
ncbi:MAG: hypothetical protein HY927_15295 [Elusimicrobia bacterium]|nr:hypothetical protein [Elusimicrobiota bacterium]